MSKTFGTAAFFAGLGVVVWVGWGYAGSNPLALAMTALIAAFYLMGGLELHRFHQATSSFRSALLAVHGNLADLGEWLTRLHPSLQNPVRLRIEGERVGLPGPSMTPYLVGLLVLLGMLGTFLGMVVTLQGAVMALESTTDLPTIRAALAAPVKGLGLAFGTSVAGVAASAALGLVSALCRRDRLHATQVLDARIATTLRVHTRAHQREETLRTLQFQATLMPEVLGKMQSMMAQMEQQAEGLNERLLASQERFQGHAQTAYERLAASVDRSLRESLTESSRAAGAAIQPVVEATMAGIARETGEFHGRLAETTRVQLDGLTARFGSTVNTVADVWTSALARHERTSDGLVEGLGHTLGRFSERFEQGTASLLESVAGSHAALQGELKTTLAQLARQTSSLNEQMADKVKLQLDGVSEHFSVAASSVSATWRDALAQHQRTSDRLSERLDESLTALVEKSAHQSASLLLSVSQAHAAQRTDDAAIEQQRLDAITQSLESTAASLVREWRQAGEQAHSQQEQICKTLEQTARDIQAQNQAHAGATITEMSRLIDTASEAPRAAAEVVAQLRQKLSESMARDNQLLDERSRIMGTLSTLLDAVNLGASDQREAIDAMVQSSAALLGQLGAQYSAKVEAESAKMSAVASQITGSAVEVASLGEAFGLAVQLFSESSEALTTHLQRIEAAMSKSTARSDEQLAYYVAQAREIIDLSIASQKQIVEDLRQIAGEQTGLASAVA